MGTIPGAPFDRRLFGGNVRVVALGPYFRRRDRQENWTFSDFLTPEDGDKHPETSVGMHMPRIASGIGAKKVWVPSPKDFNAVIAPKHLFDTEILIRSAGYAVMLQRGVRADGMLLESGDCFGLSVAGCPLLLAMHERTGAFGVAHAGRRSIINEGRLGGGPPYRQEESVVDTLLEAMGCRNNGKSQEVKVEILFPIAPNLLTYLWDGTGSVEMFNSLNKKRSQFVVENYGVDCAPGWGTFQEHLGMIDVGKVITEQLYHAGVLRRNIDIIPPPAEWYTTRGEHPDRRNAILVKRSF